MKVAIVELSESHEECIYTQVSFLSAQKHDITLFAHPKVEQQALLYKEKMQEVIMLNFDSLKGPKKRVKEYQIAKQLATFDRVIFNTASSSSSVRNINLFLLFYKVECVGIIHSVSKLNKSFTQKLISFKIKKYLALSDYLKELTRLKNKTLGLESFYPIFFPEFKRQPLKKNKDDFWICVPGRVYFERRDYLFLIEKLKDVTISSAIKFLILGNINTKDGIEFKKRIESSNLKENFVFFDEFIPNTTYYNYLDNSDYILPLLQNGEKSYLNDKITGTFNLAYAFKKVLLCDNFYNQITDLKENALFYSKDNFANFILNLHTLKDTIKPYQNKKWDYDYQAKKYLNFIFDDEN